MSDVLLKSRFFFVAFEQGRSILSVPVTAILADQLAVPSSTANSACSMESMWVSGSTLNITLIHRTEIRVIWDSCRNVGERR